MIITLLLSFLWFPNGNRVYLPRPPPLLHMKSLPWVTAHLSYLLDNDILMISYDKEANALLSMHLFSPTINITSCTFYVDISIIKAHPGKIPSRTSP